MNFPFKVVASSFFAGKLYQFIWKTNPKQEQNRNGNPIEDEERFDRVCCMLLCQNACVCVCLQSTPLSLVWQQRILAGKLTEHHAHHSQSHPIKLIKRKTMKCKTHWQLWKWMALCDFPMHFSSRFHYSVRAFGKNLFKTQVGIGSNTNSQMSRFCPCSKYFFKFCAVQRKTFQSASVAWVRFILLFSFFKIEMKPVFSQPFSLLVHSIQTIDQMKWILEKKKRRPPPFKMPHSMQSCSQQVCVRCARLSKVKFMNELLLLIPFLPLSKSTIALALAHSLSAQAKLKHTHTHKPLVSAFYSIRFSFGSFIVFISLTFVTVTLALFACMRALVCLCAGCVCRLWKETNDIQTKLFKFFSLKLCELLYAYQTEFVWR